MQPKDWEADCMIPDAWMHSPFKWGTDAVVTDGNAVVVFPARGEEFAPPRFEYEQEETENPTQKINEAIDSARVLESYCEFNVDLSQLGLSEQHHARLAAEAKLKVAAFSDRIIFHTMAPETEELEAYGVIFTGNLH